MESAFSLRPPHERNWQYALLPDEWDTGYWNSASFTALQNNLGLAPEGQSREAALKRIAVLDCNNKTLASCNPKEREPPIATEFRKAGITPEAYAKVLAGTLEDLLCKSEGHAQRVLNGLLYEVSLQKMGAERNASFVGRCR